MRKFGPLFASLFSLGLLLTAATTAEAGCYTSCSSKVVYSSCNTHYSSCNTHYVSSCKPVCRVVSKPCHTVCKPVCHVVHKPCHTSCEPTCHVVHKSHCEPVCKPCKVVYKPCHTKCEPVMTCSSPAPSHCGHVSWSSCGSVSHATYYSTPSSSCVGGACGF